MIRQICKVQTLYHLFSCLNVFAAEDSVRVIFLTKRDPE